MPLSDRILQVKRFFIIGAVFCLLLSGCVGPAEFTEDPSSRNESSSVTETRFPDYAFNTEAAGYFSGSYAVSNEDGYYLAINNILHFYDIQADTVFPLCTKESCLHKGQTCNAYICGSKGSSHTENDVFDWYANAYLFRMIYDHEHLYMIYYHPDKGKVMYGYNEDFTGQKEIVWLEDYEKAPFTRCITESVFFHNNCLYYMTWLYQEDKVQDLEYVTKFTSWRIKLDEKAEPEELFSFECVNTAWQGVRTGAYGDGIYYFIEQESHSEISESERESGEKPYRVTGSSERVFRYDEENGKAELLWSYDGEQRVALFEAEGAIPGNPVPYSILMWGDCLINSEGDYVYFAGYPEDYDSDRLAPTSIAAVNLNTREGKVLYKTPYRWIEQLRSDGQYYYFLEIAKGYTYLTCIDKEGNLVRRYEVPLDETFIANEEARSRHLEEAGFDKLTREDWGLGFLRLLVTDGRYITLGGYGMSTYKNLSSQTEDQSLDSFVDQGIGVIDSADFLGGKDIEIRQIYERTDPDPFN